MGGKSLVGTIFVSAFSLAAYIVYVIAVYDNNTDWVSIAAVMYFLPIFIEFLDDFQNVYIRKLFSIKLFIGCLLLGTIYLVVLFVYLTLLENGNIATLDIETKIWFKSVLALTPAVCLPMKFYPAFVFIMQWYNRLTD